MKPEVVDGEKKDIQPRVQTRGDSAAENRIVQNGLFIDVPWLVLSPSSEQVIASISCP